MSSDMATMVADPVGLLVWMADVPPWSVRCDGLFG